MADDTYYFSKVLSTRLPDHGTYTCTFEQVRIAERLTFNEMVSILNDAWQEYPEYQDEYWGQFPRTTLAIVCGFFTNMEHIREEEKRERQAHWDLMEKERQESIEAEAEHCRLGICDHYTCTNGRNLEEWEANNPDIAKY